MTDKIKDTFRRFPSLWLLLGLVLVVASQLRFQIGMLVWVMPVPFLHYLRRTTGWASRAKFLGVMFLAWSLAVAKIVTGQIPLAMAPLFGLPIMLFHALPYLVWNVIRKRTGKGFIPSLAFASLLTISEWSMQALTPFGTWGAAAYTQLDYLPIMQFASVAGMAGIAFLIYFASAALEGWLARGFPAVRKQVLVSALMVSAVIVFGNIRLSLSADSGNSTVLVAAVGTDLNIKPNAPLPNAMERRRVEEALRRRTGQAGRAGARLVVWNEAGYMTLKGDEQSFLSRTQSLARALKIELVVAYVVPLTRKPLRFENKYVWIRPDGTIDHSYFKRIPVPGEPAVPGSGPMAVVETAFGRLSGAICYDYDFPRLALEHARLNVDMVVLPSNDWRGIDPIHTLMASVRGIEGGHSVLRSTASGLSAGSDPYGRIRGWQSSFDSTDRIMFARLPTKGFTTIYGMLGDWLIILCGLALLFALWRAIRRKKTS